jgi:lysophospholipase L1-like esterase
MPDRPSVILIGDSICMGYRPMVRESLLDKVDILGIDGNGGDSGRLLENIDEWMINREAHLIHFNCGLHDIKLEYGAKTHQQPINVYEANLREIVKRLKEGSKALIAWATTTPVIDQRHNAVKGFDRYLRDVQAYNQIATGIMKEADIPIDDLYDAIRNDRMEDCIGSDGVHMTERGNKVLAEAVCRFILSQPGL